MEFVGQLFHEIKCQIIYVSCDISVLTLRNQHLTTEESFLAFHNFESTKTNSW